MNIPFFNLKGKAKIKSENVPDAMDTLLNLLKISEDIGIGNLKNYEHFIRLSPRRSLVEPSVAL